MSLFSVQNSTILHKTFFIKLTLRNKLRLQIKLYKEIILRSKQIDLIHILTAIALPDTKKDTPHKKIIQQTITTGSPPLVHNKHYYRYTSLKIKTRVHEVINTQSRKQRFKTRYVWVTLNFLTT